MLLSSHLINVAVSYVSRPDLRILINPGSFQAGLFTIGPVFLSHLYETPLRYMLKEYVFTCVSLQAKVEDKIRQVKLVLIEGSRISQ